MATRMTVNGVSTCSERNTENYEYFTQKIGRKEKEMVQYDYRANNGELFSCVKTSLEECREAKDKWLSQNKI